MQIFSTEDLTNTSHLPIKYFTTSSVAKGVTITNFSNVSVSMSTSSRGDLGIVPPYFSRVVGISPGTQISFSLAVMTVGTISQPRMFINVEESLVDVVPSQVALAQFPGYVSTVNLGGIPSVSIEGTPNVTVNGTVSASITSGSVTAYISNGTINTDIVNSIYSPVPVSAVNQSIRYFNTFGYGTLLSAGGIINLLCVTISNTSSAAVTVELYNNGNELYAAIVGANSSTGLLTFDFKNGIANNGITLGANGVAIGYAIVA